MKSIMSIQISLLFVLALILPHYFATSCQVYPSEYAYHEDSVTRDERASANCRSYSSGLDTKNVARTEDYIHCDGLQLRLTDSDLGLEQYSSSDYYVWRVGVTTRQLLFIFPTRVNLTTITLHYYSDSARRLPRLRFYAVPDEFNVWNAPLAIYSSVEVASVPLDGETAGRNNLAMRTNDNFNVRRVLMLSLNSAFEFAVSEVKFFTCNATFDDISTSESQSNYYNNMSKTTAVTIPGSLEMKKSTTQNVVLQNSTSPDSNILVPEYVQLYIVLPIALTTAIVVTIVLVVVLSLLLLMHSKRNHNLKTNVELEATYSTLDRGTKQQTKPESLDASAVLYDQIQLSPSTGQSELISKSERETVHPAVQLDYHNIGKPHKEEPEKNNSGFEMYAVVDKTKKRLLQIESRESQDNISDKCSQLKSPDQSLKSGDPQCSDEVEKQEDQQHQRKNNLEEMYAVVQKKPKKCEEQAPPVPSHTIESLNTAVEKKPKYQ